MKIADINNPEELDMGGDGEVLYCDYKKGIFVNEKPEYHDEEHGTIYEWDKPNQVK